MALTARETTEKNSSDYTQGYEGDTALDQRYGPIHVYSDDNHIWLQLRRDVPTEQDIGRSSFNVALCMQPGTAHKLGLELMNIAERNKEKSKAKAATTTQKASKPKAAP